MVGDAAGGGRGPGGEAAASGGDVGRGVAPQPHRLGAATAPSCAGLGEVLEGWDGRFNPVHRGPASTATPRGAPPARPGGRCCWSRLQAMATLPFTRPRPGCGRKCWCAWSWRCRRGPCPVGARTGFRHRRSVRAGGGRGRPGVAVKRSAAAAAGRWCWPRGGGGGVLGSPASSSSPTTGDGAVDGRARRWRATTRATGASTDCGARPATTVGRPSRPRSRPPPPSRRPPAPTRGDRVRRPAPLPPPRPRHLRPRPDRDPPGIAFVAADTPRPTCPGARTAGPGCRPT